MLRFLNAPSCDTEERSVGMSARLPSGLKGALRSCARFDAWLWESIHGGSDDATDLKSAYSARRNPEDPEPLTIVTVLSDDIPTDMLARYANVRTWTTRSSRGVGALAAEVSDDESFVVTAWPGHRPGTYHLASTIPVTDRRWGRVQRWMNKAAPAVVPVYLDRRDFEGFVSVLEEFGSVDASRLTGRYRQDRSSFTRGWPNPKPAVEALEEVDESVQLRTMTLAVLDTETAAVNLRLHLRRTAGATFYSGDFGTFHQIVIRRLADAADRRARLLKGRQREVGEDAPQPLEIRIGAVRFDSSDAISDLLHHLTTYTNSDSAVLHRNPYLHVVVTDYSDGSNFDVFVTDVDRIGIHPGFKASVGALVRLTDYLAEEFEADGVGEQAEVAPTTLEDLFSAS